jgi:hypothetical protein
VLRAIRLAIPAAAAAAVVLGIALPVPHSLPGAALGSKELLWLERALLFFYGFLLLFVPVLRALEGVLPIELSTRGARYAEASDAAVEALTRRLEDMEDLMYSISEVVEDDELD